MVSRIAQSMGALAIEPFCRTIVVGINWQEAGDFELINEPQTEYFYLDV